MRPFSRVSSSEGPLLGITYRIMSSDILALPVEENASVRLDLVFFLTTMPWLSHSFALPLRLSGKKCQAWQGIQGNSFQGYGVQDNGIFEKKKWVRGHSVWILCGFYSWSSRGNIVNPTSSVWTFASAISYRSLFLRVLSQHWREVGPKRLIRVSMNVLEKWRHFPWSCSCKIVCWGSLLSVPDKTIFPITSQKP